MKKIILLLTLFLSLNLIGQSGFMIGFNVSPTWKINMSTQKQTSLRNYQSGYGFTLGIPIKYWINDYSAFCSGIEYDFAAFDSYQNAQLATSIRFNSLHIPLMFNTNITDHWYALLGGGLVYNLSVRDLNNLSYGMNVTAISNRLQPYLGLGASSIKESNFGYFEYGVQLRYQLLDVWRKDYVPLQDYNSHLISFDVLFRFFL